MILSRLTLRSATWVLTAGVVAVGGPIVWWSPVLQRPSLRQDEVGFRESALYAVSPEYPSNLVHESVQGMVVVQVRLQPAGTVAAVDILESPHDEASGAVAKALLQWRFPVVRVPGRYLAARVRGKITYYFVVEHGVGVVRTPAEQARVRQAVKGVKVAASPTMTIRR